MGQVSTPKMPLSALGLTVLAGPDTAVTGLSVDSRKVKPGHLFAALPGSLAHGAEFIGYAVRMGAAAILTDRRGADIAADALANPGLSLVIVDDPRLALAQACALGINCFGLRRSSAPFGLARNPRQ
jgi:UDP-N-acetylmuramoyl-L-alanyl-D-glutamate--2,6-diaminopimelate ligase